jgi:hypothetical protein
MGMNDAPVTGDGRFDVTAGVCSEPVVNVHNHICDVHDFYSSIIVIKPLTAMTFHCFTGFRTARAPLTGH